MEQKSKKQAEFAENLKRFLKEKELKLIKKISKGYSSEVFLVQKQKGKNRKQRKKNNKFALKIEKEKSPRERMVEKEVANLKLANSLGIGPKLIDWDFDKRIILMEYIKGKTFNEWLFEKNRKKKELCKFLDKLFAQAQKMDDIGLDHGQLAGKGANILVYRNLPVIIDFEKASQHRKCHNVTQLKAMLYRNPHGEIAKRVREILGKKSPKKLTK